MSLEKDIQQSHFRNDYQKGIINLTFTYLWMNEQVKQIFERADITTQQYNILRILRGAGKPLSTLQIRQRMLDKMSDTSRIVDRLILKNLVSKTIAASDKRLVDITITEKGLELLDKLSAFDEEMDHVIGNLKPDEVKQLNQLLDKVRGSDE